MRRGALEISLKSRCADETARLESALELAGAIALTYQAGDDSAIYEPPPGAMPLWRETRITGLFREDSDTERVRAAVRGVLGKEYPLEVRFLAPSDWIDVWRDHFSPIPFGGRFWVAASGQVVDDPEALVLRLDPGLAFGTGTHPTTAMCLNYLVNHAAVAGKNVYDYGCGSGILGIAAALCGAAQVWQTDIDAQALRAAKANGEKNQVGGKITLCADPDDAPAVDLLVANILLEPLCNLRWQFEKHLKPETRLLFAGIRDNQTDKIHDVYGDAFTIETADQRDGWVLLSLTAKHREDPRARFPRCEPVIAASPETGAACPRAPCGDEPVEPARG